METTKTNNEFNVSIKDFQIIKSASLTFLPGLNCIIGQSNNGKSAILKATKSAIYNKPGTTSVRSGCNAYAVGIKANGHTIIFQKGSASSYKVDGTVLGKIGRTQLEEVAKALNIRELNLNGSNEEINFLDQMEKPFLLDRSETDLFRFIVDSGKDANITSALKTITQDRQQITRDITSTEGRLELLDSQISQQELELKNADTELAIYQRIIDLGPTVSRNKDMKDLCSIMVDLNNSKKVLSSDLDKYSKLLDETEPMLKTSEVKIKKLNLISDIVNSNSTYTNNLKELKDKLSAYNNVNCDKLSDTYTKWYEVTSLVNDYRDKKSIIDTLKNKKYPDLPDGFAEKFDLYKKCKEITNSIRLGTQQQNQLLETLSNIKSELKEAQDEINKQGVCPVCGSPLHKEVI
ncbi:MAG: AAA family ATPase [Bacilli bacterium]|nr:AAA family ATPase [Bacilli bacterium]